MRTMTWQEQGYYMPYEFDESRVVQFLDRPVYLRDETPRIIRLRPASRTPVRRQSVWHSPYMHVLAVLIIVACIALAAFATGHPVEIHP